MQRTIHWENKPSKLTHGQVTVFTSGSSLYALTRDRAKSVGADYIHVGTVRNGTMYLWGDTIQYRLIARWLDSNGRDVVGTTIDYGIKIRVFDPQRDGYSHTLTDVESIKKAIGEIKTRRRKSLSLGVKGKADQGPVSVAEMRAAILLRNKDK